MPRPPLDVYVDGLAFMTAAVTRVPEAAWGSPSPCAGWTVLDVLGHVGTTTVFGIDLLEGGQPAWEPSASPGDAVEGPPERWWLGIASRADRMLSTVDATRSVDTPAGHRTVGEGLSFPAVDLFVHGWDLARSAGTDLEIPAMAIEFAHAVLDPIPPDRLRSPATFGPPRALPPGATSTDAFIAWTGRDPEWRAPGSEG